MTLFVFLVLLVPVLAVAAPLAVAGTPGASFWATVAAATINVTGVLLLVQGITVVAPYLKERIPWAVPLIAMLAGPGIAQLQGLLSGYLGAVIDLSQVQIAFQVALGGAAVAVNQMYQQQQRVAASGGGLVSLKKL